MFNPLVWSLIIIAILLSQQVNCTFTVVGNKILYNNQSIKFKGIGLSCTEKMFEPGIDQNNQYRGQWAYEYCFGGPSSQGGPLQLNDEVNLVINYLISNFETNPIVRKVAFEPPYDQIINPAPSAFPVVRIPITGSSFLYDDDTDVMDHSVYVDIIDALVTAFTSKNVGVILALHWDCPENSKVGCPQPEQHEMALKFFGSLPGSRSFWDKVSSKYTNNELVMYELYSSPHLTDLDTWYAGNSNFRGMNELYEIIRTNDPDGIIIIGGNLNALDAQSGLYYYLRRLSENATIPTNVLYSIHPYQGNSQGLEYSLRSIMRLSLALQQIGPVIFTELGQFCCGPNGNPCRSALHCEDHAHGDHYVYNIINMAEQYDFSWVGWSWRGKNGNQDSQPCGDGMTDCSLSDMRDVGGILSNGSRGGANWKQIWKEYASQNNIQVKDAAPSNIGKNDTQPPGFLPRPCIVGGFNMGDICGYDLMTDITELNYSVFSSQTVYTSVLPGLPPARNCTAQGCVGYPCQTYTGPCR